MNFADFIFEALGHHGLKPEPEHLTPPKKNTYFADYVEVKSNSDSRPESTKKDRSDRIASEAAEKFKLDPSDPIGSLLHSVFWSRGAHWADEHPPKEYSSSRLWEEAGFKYFLTEVLPAKGLSTLLTTLMLSVVFLSGALWSKENPIDSDKK